ncbi:MAG: ABC transporter substrate-binding protein [Gammaproteobacteria bacterium]|nr:ABC transporter substrate-binding protein [Gammaproteobacteria bacterium]
MSEELNSRLPDEIREAGVIRTAGPVTEPPRLYLNLDEDTAAGYMIDLANAVGDVLGVEIEFSEMPFVSLMPGLQRGVIDMTLTISDKKERQDLLDFVDYLKDGVKILVPAGNPNGIDGLQALCGHTVAVLRGSVAVTLATEADKSCADPIEIKEFHGAHLAQLAVRAGQADASFGGETALNYLAHNVGDGTVFEVAPGGPYTIQPDAFAFLNGNDQLRDSVQAALQRLVDDGTAAKILERYGVDSVRLYRCDPH